MYVQKRVECSNGELDGAPTLELLKILLLLGLGDFSAGPRIFRLQGFQSNLKTLFLY